MPTFGASETDVRRWTLCMQQAGAAMLAEGWNRHARKFFEVRQRRARKLYAKGRA